MLNKKGEEGSGFKIFFNLITAGLVIFIIQALAFSGAGFAFRASNIPTPVYILAILLFIGWVIKK